MYESNKTEYHAFSAEYFSLLILATNKKIIISRWVHDFARQFKIFSMRYYNIPTHVHLCISFPACMPKHWTLKFIYIESAIIRRWRRVVYDPIYIYLHRAYRLIIIFIFIAIFSLHKNINIYAMIMHIDAQTKSVTDFMMDIKL